MKKLIPLFSICLLSTLILPVEQASADIYKDIAALKKQTKKQRGDIKLLQLRLDKLEQLVNNAATVKHKAVKKSAPAAKSGIITYP